MKPISNTAFYCCGVRMQDSENNKSVCKDVYAENFMDERGKKIFSAFTSEINPNAGNVSRHRIIDDFLRKELLKNPEIQVILVGAGFDSRAYRLKGGNWIELDEPQIITYKNDKLPIDLCENNIQRIPIDFESETLEDKLQSFSSTQPVIVFIYLDENHIKKTLNTLNQLFPNHLLVCDLMTENFYRKYSHTLHKKFGEFGAKFKFTSQRPVEVFCNSNYQLVEKQSIVGKAIEYGSINVPILIFKYFLKTLRDGYSIYVFKAT